MTERPLVIVVICPVSQSDEITRLEEQPLELLDGARRILRVRWVVEEFVGWRHFPLKSPRIWIAFDARRDVTVPVCDGRNSVIRRILFDELDVHVELLWAVRVRNGLIDRIPVSVSCFSVISQIEDHCASNGKFL